MVEEIGSDSYIDLIVDGNLTLMSGNGIASDLIPLAGDNLLTGHLAKSISSYTFFEFTDSNAELSKYNFSNATITISSFPVPTHVTIDIKPGSDPNSVNPKSKGVVPVAVLGSIDFDATQVDFSTVTFGPGGASPSHDGHVEDVNDDGFVDMVFHFKTQETGIACGDADATLEGETFGGIPFTGTDPVKTVGCNRSNQETSISTKGAGAMSWIFLVGLSVLGLWRRNR